MKIVVNKCYGGFGLSHEAMMLYAKKKNIKLYVYQKDDNGKFYLIEGEPNEIWPMYFTEPLNNGEFINEYYFDDGKIKRDDSVLISIIEELGDKANGECAKLAIVDIPDDVKWNIAEYDGLEHVEEVHRRW